MKEETIFEWIEENLYSDVEIDIGILIEAEDSFYTNPLKFQLTQVKMIRIIRRGSK